MPPPVAISAVAALMLVLAGTLVWAWRRPAIAATVAALFGALILVLSANGSGMFARTNVPKGVLETAARPEVTNAQCREMLGVADKAKAIIDLKNPPQLVVADDLWTKLPEPIRNALVECVERSWPAGSESAQIVPQPS